MSVPAVVKLAKHYRGDGVRLTFDITSEADFTNVKVRMTFRYGNGTGPIVLSLDSDAHPEDFTVTVISSTEKKIVSRPFQIMKSGNIYWDMQLDNNDWDLTPVSPFAGVWRIEQDRTPP